MKRLKSNFVEIIKAKGFAPDIWGHYKKQVIEASTGKVKLYQYKITARRARLELRIDHEASAYCPASHSWILLESFLLPKDKGGNQ